MPKRKQGRPSKIEAFTREMEKFFQEGETHPVGHAIIFTDEDLVEMLNERLPEEDRIDIRSFRRYKAGELQDNKVLSVFLSSYKKALQSQADRLFRNLQDGIPGEWQKYAWIIERKFDDWNLRQKQVDETPDVKRLVFRVSSDD